MVVLLKILGMLCVPLLLILPYLPLRWSLSFSSYAAPRVSRRRTMANLVVLALLAAVFTILVPVLHNFFLWLGGLKPIAWLLSKIPVYAAYATDLAVILLINAFYCLCAFVVLQLVQGGAGLLHLFKNTKNDVLTGKDKLKKKLRGKDKPRKKKNQTDPDAMPQNLLPAPEPPVAGSKILIPGAAELRQPKKKPLPKKAAAAGAVPDADEKEPGFFVRAARAVRNFFLEPSEDSWFVRPQTRHAGKHLRNFLLLVGLMYTLVLIVFLIPVFFPLKDMAEWLYKPLRFFLTVNYFYPALALGLLVVLFWLMNGKTVPVEPTEAEQDPDAQQKGRMIDLDAVESSLMEVCGKDFDVQSFYSGDVQGSDAPRVTVNLSENQLLRSVADHVRAEGLTLNQEYLLGIQQFSEGKNVLFHAPLYTAVGAYLYAALNLRILQGERIVAICHNRSQIPNYIEQMNQGFLRLTRTHKPLWRIVTREQLSRDGEEDILVLTPEDFRDPRLFSSATEFFSQVTVALLPDANLVVSSNNYFCQIIAMRLRRFCKKEPQYLFLSTRTALNLDNALTEFFLLRSKPEYARGDYSYGDVHVYVWRAKTEGAVMLDNAARAMPLEVCISDVANKFGITEPNLISDSAIYSNQINPRWLDIYDATRRPLGFAIVADDSFNLPSVIYAYSRYIGKQASVLHIITRQYLLRNYFYQQAPRYLFEQPLLERSMVEHAKQDRSAMLLLLCQLMEGIPIDDFVLQMQRFSDEPLQTDTANYNDISALVTRCLTLALGHAPDPGQEHFTLYRPKDTFYPRQHIRIDESYDVLSRQMEETELIRLRFRSGSRSTVLINLFRRMLDQRYLPGQNLVFANQNYEIKSIDRAAGVIEVDDASSVHGLARDYVQLRSYRLNDGSFTATCRDCLAHGTSDDPDIRMMRKDYVGDEVLAKSILMLRTDHALNASSDTLGYYMIQTDGRGLRVTDSTIPVIRLGESVKTQLHRSVSGGIYLRLELNRERDDRLTMTLAALLQEMLKTLFPDCYFCLSVCPILKDPEAIYSHPDGKSSAIAQLYPRIEQWGEVEPNSIELLLVDDCAGGTGAMNLLFEPEGTFLQNVLWMLSDYLQWQRDNEPSPYIFFGMESQPAIFDLDGLRPILQSFARSYVREHDIHSQIDAGNRCALCGRTLDEQPFLWHGKHMICRSCSEAYVPDAEEAERILRYAAAYLNDTFAVALPELKLRVEPQLPEDALSGLDLQNDTILLAEDLPLIVVHTELITQLVRYWQLTCLDLTGALEIEGQCPYVKLQYLRYLQQFQYAQSLHRQYLLGTDDASRGYCILLQALQSEGHDNSFLYLLQGRRKNSVTPVKPFTKRTSTRTLDPSRLQYYYRSTLSEAEMRAYDAILQALMAQQETVDISTAGIGVGRADYVCNGLLRDHPEIFWAEYGTQSVAPGGGNTAGIVHLHYVVTPEQRESLQREIDAAMQPFLEQIAPEMGDYDVALKLYEKITELLDYDTLALEREKRLKHKNGLDKLRTIYGAIVERKAVCAGYARAYQYLLQHFGVEAIYVAGVCTDGGRHGWVIAKLEDEYYHFDVTWADQSNTEPTRSSEGMTYAYFAITDEQIHQSRTPDSTPVPPKCTSESCNYFVRNGLYFTKYDAAAIRQKLTEQLQDPAKAFVELRFANRKLLREAKYFLCTNGGLWEALRAAGRDAPGFTYSCREDLALLSITLKQ